MRKPFDIVKDFEHAVCEYTGAPYAVAVSSCTMAILLAVAYCRKAYGERIMAVEIPKKTYVSVPMSIIHAGGKVLFRDQDWLGKYDLSPLPVWDCARLFTGGMFQAGKIQCVSFHATKILHDTQGGAILHDIPEADAWFRRMRFDGRTEHVPPKDDDFQEVGYHCYMSPDIAARLLNRIHFLPEHNPPLPNDDYPDLSQFDIFK